MSKLSVIVVNWNGRKLLPECLSSLSSQSLRNLEVLLVDNGSSDDSVSYVQREFPNVRTIVLPQNYGFAAANNRGIESSSGEFVALLNNDAVADCQWAKRLLDSATDPHVGIVASKVVLHGDRARLDSAGDGMTTVGVAYKRGHLAPSSSYSLAEDVFGASGCAMLLRRSMIEDIGRLDEDFFLLYEDSDLCFRAQLRGWKCRYAPDAVVYHKLNTSIRRLSRVHVLNGQRNVEYVYFKNMPGWLALRYLPAHLLNAALAFLYFSSKGQLLSFIKSKIGFLRSIPRVLRKRRIIQSRRTISCRDLNRLLDRRWLRVRLPGK